MLNKKNAKNFQYIIKIIMDGRKHEKIKFGNYGIKYYKTPQIYEN